MHDYDVLPRSERKRRARCAAQTALAAERAKRNAKLPLTAAQKRAKAAHVGASAAAKAKAKATAAANNVKWVDSRWKPPKWVDPRATMEERVAASGKTFLAIGFAHSAACSGALPSLLKKLSCTGAHLRGHNESMFYAVAQTDIAMTLHRAGSHAALNRAYNIQANCLAGAGFVNHGDGPLGASHTYAPLHARPSYGCGPL